MRPRAKRIHLTAALVVSLGPCALACRPAVTGVPLRPPLAPVAAADAPDLPPLPSVSPRNASYTIEARLDPARRTIIGSLRLDWRNTSTVAVSRFPFHLYWNAFRNNRSTAAKGSPRRRLDPTSERNFGWTTVKRVTRLADGQATQADEDLTPGLHFVHEDGNPDDRTVVEASSARPVAPGETARFRVEWESLVPHGASGRAGWVHDYHFIAQWFPKIGVLSESGWNAHPFYAWTEFFSDFGVYDVRLTLPRGFVVGATGRLSERRVNEDGTQTLRFVQEDVHDFAWAASRRFLERAGRFDDPGYPSVAIRLLLQPEHAHLAPRYLEATKIALRALGSWAAPYPYPQITVVDPAWGSSSGGMEYPTLFTGGAQILSPPDLQSPESVTVHEAGHQFWHGLVANNEFEEAWLDEGFDTYMTTRALEQALGPPAWGRRFFGGDLGRGANLGWPFVARSVAVPRELLALSDLRERGEDDVMARPGWTYRDGPSYRLNSYAKPALVLRTLEGLLGEETMLRVLRTYARRFRFAHPSTADFVATVNEVTGRDWRWFFEQTFFSSDLCDYGVSGETRPASAASGWFEDANGRLELHVALPRPDGPVDSRVTIVRHGAVRLPVELEVEFEQGKAAHERWDGQDRWKRFSYPGRRVVRAVVDPQRRVAIDVDPVNNEWLASDGPARRAATRWAQRYLFWLQNLMETGTVIG